MLKYAISEETGFDYENIESSRISVIYCHTSYYRVLPIIMHQLNHCFPCFNEIIFATISELDVSNINSINFFKFVIRNRIQMGI